MGSTAVVEPRPPGTPVAPAWIHVAGFRWRINPAFLEPALLKALQTPELLLNPPAVSLKNNPYNRTTQIVRTRLPGWRDDEVVVKRYEPEGGWRSLKACFRASRASRSFELALRLRAAGIATPEPIAAGERWRRGRLLEAYLITEAVHASRDAKETLLRCATSLERRRLVCAVARVLAALHRAGFVHRDLHLANFICATDQSAAVEPVVIDLDGIRPRGKPVSPREAAEDLRRGWERRNPLRPVDLFAFLAAYSRSNPDAPRPRDLLRLIGVRDPVRGSSNKHGEKVPALAARSLRWQIRSETDRITLAPLLATPDAFLRNPYRQFKNSRNVTIARVQPPGGAPECVLRRLNYGKLVHRLRDCFRGSRVQRAFRLAVELDRAGIPTPRAFAAGEWRRFGFWPRCAYLITEALAAEPLDGFARHRPSNLAAVAVRLAKLLGRLHRAGYSHRDLKPGNILVLREAEEPCLIDLDAVRRYAEVPDWRAARDLARLADGLRLARRLTVTLRVRFLQAYSAARQRGDWRQWWRRIEVELKRHYGW